MRIFSFAIKNLKRKTIRTVMLLLIIAVVSSNLFSTGLFIFGIQNGLKTGINRLGADILVVPENYASEIRSALFTGEPSSFYMDRGVFDRIKKIEGVKKASPQIFVKPASFTCCYNVDVFLVAFDPETDFTITPWLEKNLKRTLAWNEIITGKEVSVTAGDVIPFFGTPFNVISTMDPTGMKFFDTSVFMPIDAAYMMAENSKTKSIKPIDLDRNKISAVLIQVKDGYTPESIAIKIEYGGGVKAIVSDEVISTVKKQLNGILKAVVVTGTALWILSLLVMGFAFSMIVNERQREIGLLRAMGAKKTHIFSLIITEAVIVTFAGSIIGLLLGSIFLGLFKNFIIHSMKLPYLLPSTTVLVVIMAGVVIFSLITGLLSSLLPALSAIRMEPYQIVRKGE